MSDHLRVLAIYAHPDDECYCSGGTLAKYHAEGAETMVISATRGQAGQINDARAASRQTLGDIREQELRLSCQRLGVDHVQCWDYMDGALSQADRRQLNADIVQVLREFQPDVVLTFGIDGAYGHPDHIAICQATTQAFRLSGLADYADSDLPPYQPKKLYYAHFPEQRLLLLDELSNWLSNLEDIFQGSQAFIHGLSVFAEESAMLHYNQDFVKTKWFPPGFCIIEQGEISNSLYVIMSGKVSVQVEDESGNMETVAHLKAGQFFGQTGIAYQQARNAYVIAEEGVTCLVFEAGEPTLFAGRGENATLVTGRDQPQTSRENTGQATHRIDVTNYIPQKISSIAAHRTQAPIMPDMFPLEMLKKLFGIEYFVQVYPDRKLYDAL